MRGAIVDVKRQHKKAVEPLAAAAFLQESVTW
jgi:hypothetical protein